MFSVKIGQRVAYSVQFLRSIGASHSDMAHGRGEVVALSALGSITLAAIRWDNGADLPRLVNVENLAIVGANTRFCQC